MTETLYEAIRKAEKLIGEVSRYTNIVLDQVKREIYEDWSKRNRVVKDVKGGKTTFTEEYEKTLKPYEFKRMNDFYRLGSSLPSPSREDMAELVAAIGYSGFDDSHVKHQNLGGAMLSGFGLGAIISSIRLLTEKQADRRDLFKWGIGITSLLGTGGLVGSAWNGILTTPKYLTLKQNAIYLDNDYNSVFKKE